MHTGINMFNIGDTELSFYVFTEIINLFDFVFIPLARLYRARCSLKMVSGSPTQIILMEYPLKNNWITIDKHIHLLHFCCWYLEDWRMLGSRVVWSICKIFEKVHVKQGSLVCIHLFQENLEEGRKEKRKKKEN